MSSYGKYNAFFIENQIKTTEIYCNPEVFILGCFKPLDAERRNWLQNYIRSKAGKSFTTWSFHFHVLQTILDWFAPSKQRYTTGDHKGKYNSITNRFKSDVVCRIGHKLPKITTKFLSEKLFISERTLKRKLPEFKVDLIRSYVSDGMYTFKQGEKYHTKYLPQVRYIALELHKILAVCYTPTELQTAFKSVQEKAKDYPHYKTFFKDVLSLLSKAYHTAESGKYSKFKKW